MSSLAQWLSETRASLFIHDFDWLVPLLQTVHILAIAMVLSSVLMIDLRLLGIAKSQSLQSTARRFVPWIWSGLAILVASGITLIIAEPQRALPNPAFQIKMALLAVAIAITVLFQVSLGGGRLSRFSSDQNRSVSNAAVAILAALTFILWCAIAFAGRLIAYFQPA